jgi:hypothetical protein
MDASGWLKIFQKTNIYFLGMDLLILNFDGYLHLPALHMHEKADFKINRLALQRYIYGHF